jgi:hypothetical protein
MAVVVGRWGTRRGPGRAPPRDREAHGASEEADQTLPPALVVVAAAGLLRGA